MLDWHPREHRPATKGHDIILAFQCFGSEPHPTKPKQFLGWEYEVIKVDDFDSTNELGTGWPATDATYWAYIQSPT